MTIFTPGIFVDETLNEKNPLEETFPERSFIPRTI
jgi:hypothetical protein